MPFVRIKHSEDNQYSMVPLVLGQHENNPSLRKTHFSDKQAYNEPLFRENVVDDLL
jgi:hypothetical protein